MTKFGDAPIKKEGDIVDPDECIWECDCEKCQAKYKKWKAAYDDKGKGGHMTGFKSKREMAQEDDDIQDYKKPWVGLTDAEVDAAWGAVAWHSGKGLQELRREYARAIEQALKDKNNGN